MTEVEGQLLGRALRIGRVLAKYGLRERSGDGSLRERAASLRSALEELGPTFAKLGQILSTRPDLLPPEFVAELEKLQDDVPPLTEAEVVLVMEEELGVPWEDVFEHLSSARLLVLEFVPGVPIRQAPDTPERRDAARQLIESYYRQILTDGF